MPQRASSSNLWSGEDERRREKARRQFHGWKGCVEMSEALDVFRSYRCSRARWKQTPRMQTGTFGSYQCMLNRVAFHRTSMIQAATPPAVHACKPQNLLGSGSLFTFQWIPRTKNHCPASCCPCRPLVAPPPKKKK